MNKWLSYYLDFCRVVAALVVFVWHTEETFFSQRNLIDLFHLSPQASHLAVVTFFVLSGFLIDRSASKPSSTLRGFVFDRAARLYSVIIPAILLTVLVGLLVSYISPSNQYAGYRQNWMSVRYVVNLLNLQQIWFFCVVPGANPPFWSLSYEFWYYVALAAMTYFKGRERAIWFTLVALVAGPKIILLAPAWIAGVVSHRIYKLDLAVPKILAVPALTLTAIILALSIFIDPPFNPWRSMTIQYPWYYSSQAVLDFFFSILVSINLLSVAWVFQGDPSKPRHLMQFCHAIRWFSSRTFSLYLYHFPLLFFAGSVVSYDKSDTVHVGLVAFAVLMLCLGLAQVTECQLSKIKSGMITLGSFWLKQDLEHNAPDVENES